jgi:hypothetical protein
MTPIRVIIETKNILEFKYGSHKEMEDHFTEMQGRGWTGSAFGDGSPDGWCSTYRMVFVNEA